MQIIANGAHHYFPSVEPDPDAQLQAVGTAHLLGIRLHSRLHGQGRIAGAQGVIFVSNGGAKQGHDAVAQHLVDRAFKTVHGVHHALQGGVEELLGRFGVETPDQLRGVFDVGKQYRDLLALAFQGTAGHENLLGQVRGRVGERFLCGSGG